MADSIGLKFNNYTIYYNIQTNGNLMILIRQLQLHLKAKKKQPQPSNLLAVLQILQTSESLSINLTQKGVILHLLAGVCLQQFQLFKKVAYQFTTKVQSGNFEMEKTKTQVRNKYRERGNSTTVKRKKHLVPETARNALTLDEMLEKQLSTPINTEPRSQHSAYLLQGNENIAIPTIEKIQVSPLIYSSLITPVKELPDEEDRKLEEYRNLINQPSKQKQATKNKDGTLRTRKKARQTQSLQQQINPDISLNLCSQVSVRKQLEGFLESTKKKKAKQKENLFCHELFDPTTQIFSYDNKTSLKLFFNQDQTKFRERKLFLDSPKDSFHAQFDNFSPQPQGPKDLLFLRQNDEIQGMLDAQIKENNGCSLNTFSRRNHFTKIEKSILFYDLLCSSSKYGLKQENVQTFGDISITIEMNSF